MPPEPSVWILLAAALGGYASGSIPWGLLLTKAAGLGDVRDIGSGNIGATNVLRTGNRWLALATFLLDCAKAAVPTLIALRWGDAAAGLAGVGAVLGHNFPIWLGFRGGKGVASTLGVLLALAWPAGLATIAAWLVVAFVSRRSSLAALTSLACAPLAMLAVSTRGAAAVAALLAALAALRHRDNIRRLLAGSEPRIGAR